MRIIHEILIMIFLSIAIQSCNKDNLADRERIYIKGFDIFTNKMVYDSKVTSIWYVGTDGFFGPAIYERDTKLDFTTFEK